MVHTNGRLMRYLLALQGFNFSIYYRKGTENCDADAVSRLLRVCDAPVYQTEDELDGESGVVSAAMLQRARQLSQRNEKAARDAAKALRKLDKEELQEFAKVNDHILQEGVEEDLTQESGRERFF